MLFAVLYLALGTLAAACQPDGDHAVTCQTDKCETVDSTEICTGCKAGGVPIDGFCWPASSPPAALAGCVPGESSGVCTRCSSEGYFLFMGGCYKAGSTSSQTLGDSICETIQDGRCTKCKADGNVFQNKADSPALGSECILCSDTTGANKNTGVANCLKCTAPDSKEGAATCSECAAGSYKSGNTCLACVKDCISCTADSQCTACKPGTYLKDNTCGESTRCAGTEYADKNTWSCKACSEIKGCTKCTYNENLQKPVCSSCTTGGKTIIKVKLDGTTMCVDAAGCATDNVDGSHFLNQAKDKCLLCSDDKTDASNPPNKGLKDCRTCKKENAGANPVCSECLPGFYLDGTCKPCGANCATCDRSAKDTCLTCKAGFFLKSSSPGECVACNSIENKGLEGCSACSNSGGFKCTDCKVNYKRQSKGEAPDDFICTKVCEDETACGGTAGACDAVVIDDAGKELHYCSFCGDSSKYPIDGRCNSAKGSNTCDNGVCTRCGGDYFLYMGGCYKVDQQPGNYMCSNAAAGICSAANVNNRFFAIPNAQAAQQSVLACGNPVGTAVADKAYVGVEGCSQCTPPTDPAANGMMVATCTACEAPKKPTGNGVGCAVCSDANCRHCRVDGVCEECSSGFSLEGGKCVSTGGPNLSTGAIAGISVAAIVVVGGLVGFLCWWFICRGKA
ncbi:VSP [Giardia lamblia P15]|uniref:VSP n=1 Tax=Giardia intestinalis (strain P15) TaxID=658858 RepID=E1F3X7_GIAIA|nr:VSP [Giardia lamblia P15]